MSISEIVIGLLAFLVFLISHRIAFRAGREQGYDLGYAESSRRHFRAKGEWREMAGMTGLEDEDGEYSVRGTHQAEGRPE